MARQASLEHSLDSDSEPDEETVRLDPQTHSPVELEDPDFVLTNPELEMNSGLDRKPPALPESEPPELETPDEPPTSSLAQLSIN